MLNTRNSQTLETRATHRVRIISRKYGVTYTVRSLKIQSQKYSIVREVHVLPLYTGTEALIQIWFYPSSVANLHT